MIATNKQPVAERVFDLLRSGRELTRQEIAASLSLSMPTTLQNVTGLLEAGILEESGAAKSSGGRKARRLRLRAEAGQVLGIDVAVCHVELISANLLGEVQRSQALPLAFTDTPGWYDGLHQALTAFLQEASPAPVLGAGISFPGTLDGPEWISSHIFRLSHMGLDRFRRAVPFPVVFENDANCACCAELPTAARHSYFYLSLNETVGGAVMLDGSLLTGDTFQAGEVGHVLLIPGGERCYCGKSGCADAYLSPKVLGDSLERFFDRQRAGEPEAQARWERYLDHLAILLTNLRMLYNMNLIVGGAVGAQIAPSLPALRARAAAYDRFARDIDYIFPCACREHACAAGAARLALDRFSSRILEPVLTESPAPAES